MATGSVVLHFDVLEKGLTQGVGVHLRHTMDALDFQAMEKALHHRIVVAVAPAAHPHRQPSFPMVGCGILGMLRPG